MSAVIERKVKHIVSRATLRFGREFKWWQPITDLRTLDGGATIRLLTDADRITDTANVEGPLYPCDKVWVIALDATPSIVPADGPTGEKPGCEKKCSSRD